MEKFERYCETCKHQERLHEVIEGTKVIECLFFFATHNSIKQCPCTAFVPSVEILYN